MATSLLATKLSAPPAPQSLIRRARLLDRLEEGRRRKLTLISAPAGSGKTTLVAAWAAAARLPVAWLSLDEHDNDPHRFWTYAITVLASLRSGEADLLPQPGLSQAPEATLAEWINEIVIGIPTDFLLVLDDYHLITNPSLHRSLTFLLDHSPATMHVIIGTRQDPPLPLALLRARNQLLEVRAGDLSFTKAEAAAFVHRMMGLDLPAAAVEALQARTEGWAAGLQLAALSMRGRADLPAFIGTFAGTHRYIVDYLAEQVLQRQDAGLQRFLLDTSILDRLSGPLCDAVTGEPGGQARLEWLERANLFLVPLDDERRWYRYHQLFADFLRHCLQQAEPQRTPELHRRAALWHEQQKDASQAFEHWVKAGELAQAARLVAEFGKEALKRGEVRLLQSWTEQLPGDVVRECPWVGIYRAWTLALTGQSAGIETCLGEIEQRIPHDDTLAAVRQRGLAGELAALQAFTALHRGQAVHARALAQAALEKLPAEEQSTRSVAHLTMGLAETLLNEPGAATDSFREAARVGREAGNLHAFVPAAHELAAIQVRQGRLRQAMETLQDALRFAGGPGTHPLPAWAYVYAGIAGLLYQWNDLEAAAPCAEQAATLSRQWGFVDAMLRCLPALARICHARGQVERGEALNQEADEMARRHAVIPQSASWWAADKLRWLVVQGRHSQAARFAQERGLTLAAEITQVNEAEYLSLARLLLVQGRTGEALGLLERLLEFAHLAGRTGRLIEALALQALTLRARGENAQAGRALARALALAEPEGYIRLFVDEGPALAQLLQQVRRTGDESLARYAGRLLAAFGRQEGKQAGTHPPPLGEPLTERELQILHLIAAGRTYQEIARELIIAVGTVQTYVRSLYPKLDVHSGLEAVARGRQMGLLPP